MPATNLPTGEGATVYLLGCPAYIDTFPCSLIGLFDVEEYLPYEPANYVQSPTYVVAPHDGTDGPFYDVDVYDYIQHVRPAEHARQLVQEREWDIKDSHSLDEYL